MLRPDEIRVFFARPEALDGAADRDAALALLEPAERERIARFHFERDRRLHLVARALLRRSLSECDGGVPPAAWRFEARPGGRPELAAPASPLRFSVSHTPGLAMVAVSNALDIGADAERIPAQAPADVIERTFTSLEQQGMARAAPADRPARFTAIWTLKEAYAKALGLGLSLELDRVGFELAPPRLVTGADAELWHLECMAPTPEHRAAVCVRRSGENGLVVSVSRGTTPSVP